MDINPGDRFAHYTSADAALKIIGGDAGGNRNLWLRNSRLMNDYTEVEWGQWCLKTALNDWRLHNRFQRVLNTINPGLYNAIEEALTNEQAEIGEKAHLLSLAIHDEVECRTGKLSMWRAYGGEANVCLIFNTAPFMNYQTAYELVLSPVMYGGPEEFIQEFQGVVHRLEQCVRHLKVLQPNDVFLNIKRALDFAVLSMKHAGFHEETEWRVIHQHSELRPDPPFIRDPSDPSKRVYQIPLESRPDAGLWGANISDILDCILVGPVKDYDTAKYVVAYWVEILRKAGLSYPEQRVKFCDIPLSRRS